MQPEITRADRVAAWLYIVAAAMTAVIVVLNLVGCGALDDVRCGVGYYVRDGECRGLGPAGVPVARIEGPRP